MVLLTGRPLRVRDKTVAWLDKWDLRWDLLITHPAGKFTKSAEFKRGALVDLRAFGFDVRLAFEDDVRNQAMFRAEGVPCVYLHSGYYD